MSSDADAAPAAAQDNKTTSQQPESTHLVDDHNTAGKETDSESWLESNSESNDETAVGYCGDPLCSVASCATANTDAETIVLVLYVKLVSDVQRYKFWSVTHILECRIKVLADGGLPSNGGTSPSTKIAIFVIFFH